MISYNCLGVNRAVDLCAAPGSWSQVLARKLNDRETIPGHVQSGSSETKIIAVDIQTMAPIDGVTLIQGDITDPDTADKILQQFQGCKAQLIVCDGAPDVTGQHDLDEFIQSQLLLAALNITTFILETKGTFVAKIFRGKDISLMMMQLKSFFERVSVVKPKSSRTSSIEAFVICQNFRMPTNYKPHFYSLLTPLSDPWVEVAKHEEGTNVLAPFMMCGDLISLTDRLSINES